MDKVYGMNSNVDYSKWQRKSLPIHQRVSFSVASLDEIGESGLPSAEGWRASTVNRPGGITKEITEFYKDRTKTIPKDTSYEQERRYSHTSDLPTPIVTRTVLESACSSRCRHLPQLKLQETKVTESCENAELIRTMKFQIKAKHQCVLEYKKQILNLIKENVKLKRQIQGNESGTHDHVKVLLEKYHKLRGAMGRISQEHTKQKAVTEQSFKEVKEVTESGLMQLNKKLDELQAELVKKQNELRTLNNYKNKEYPEKVLKIKSLKKELESLQMLLRKDMKEMDEIIEVESAKYQENAAIEEFNVIKSARNQMFDIMDAGVKETALQNIRLKKEIEIQRAEKSKLEKENSEIESNIKKLMARKDEIKRKKYPGLFLSTDKCLPDAEIELSIPKKQFIPI